jgi:acyl carrier protein
VLHNPLAVTTPQTTLAEKEDYEAHLELELQGRIKDIWQQLLGVEQIGLNDDFFDLGGDSLLMTRLASRISEMLPVELSLNRIYDNPTVASIANTVTGLLLDASQPTEISASL